MGAQESKVAGSKGAVGTFTLRGLLAFTWTDTGPVGKKTPCIGTKQSNGEGVNKDCLSFQSFPPFLSFFISFDICFIS